MSLSKLILNIYDNIVRINNDDVIISFDKYKNIWFSLPHLLKALDYSTYREEIKSIRDIVSVNDISTFEKVNNATNTLLTNTSVLGNSKIQGHTKMISESGLYLLLSKSRKPIAMELKNELFTKVLPDIRKQGNYKMNKQDKMEIIKLNEKIKLKSQKIRLYKREINRTKKHLYKNTTGHGFIYVLKVKTILNGQNKICYKFGYTTNLEKRLATYRTGNPDVELAHHENLQCNKKQLERCIINLNILKRLKNKTEVICDVPLEKIKKEIEDCKKLLKKHSSIL